MIYLDHSATTPICDAAKRAIIEHLDDFGNPSSVYEHGRKARLLIEDARERIAQCINAEPYELYFTSGGSESNTWALNGSNLVMSNIEHHSISSTSMLKVRAEQTGLIDPNAIDMMLRRCDDPSIYTRPLIVSCMTVNNELGTKNNIGAIAKVARKHGALFHTDAIQAIGHIPIDVKRIDCDMLSASGHKFGSPKGVGFLYIKDETHVHPLICGGKQEQGRRPGTENVLGIISMAAALEDAVEHMEERNEHIKYLRDKMLNKLLYIPGSHLNGSMSDRVSSNINIRFDGVSGARLVTLCDLYGVCISSGSACNAGVATSSHVLKAIGLSDTEALSSVRITLGHENTEKEIDAAADIIISLVRRIRENEET
jgi:cysteine desulfurase